jgi:phosphoglycolate phosphatase
MIKSECGGDTNAMHALASALGYDLSSRQFHPTSIVIAATVEEIAQVMLPFVAETELSMLIYRMNTAASAAPQVEVTPLTPLFQTLKSRGLKIGLATNDAEAPARAHLGQADVASYFDFIVGSDSGFGGKPAPGQLHGFCAQTGVAPETCAMIGDSLHDLQAGRAAGMICLGVLTGPASRADLEPFADAVLTSISELPKWLDQQ